jgi:hypothetical protein
MVSRDPAVRDEASRSREEHPARKGLWFNIAVTAIEIGGAIALFHLAERMGASDVVSYLVGCIGPITGGVVIWVRARKFSGASAAIFAFTALSAIIAVFGSTSPKALLYKDCATTALIGLIFLASCIPLVPRPVVFYMAQRYGSDGTHAGMATFDTMWDSHRGFRTSIYTISCLWAALFLTQAAATTAIIHRSSYSTAYNYDQTLPLLATVLGVVGSVLIARYFTKKGRARRFT